MSFTEARLEQAIIDLLVEQGYPHVLGPSITRSPQEVLIKDDLREFLKRQYGSDGITHSEIDSVIRQLEVLPHNDLYETNKAIMKMVCDGFTLKREDRTQKDLYIHLIEYEDFNTTQKPADALQVRSEDPAPYYIDRNIYRLVNQLEIVGYETRIPRLYSLHQRPASGSYLSSRARSGKRPPSMMLTYS